MIRLLGLLATVGFFAGCGSKPRPELLHPGDTPTWRTVDFNQGSVNAADRPRVILDTTYGPITIELYRYQAPISTENFLSYVEAGFYDETIFHRVIANFMIQGGGYTREMGRKVPNEPIRNEAGNGLSNKRGTIAMARESNVHSATSQFYISVVDNTYLDGDGVNGGYAVFGEVTAGMDVVDKITMVQTHSVGSHNDVPTEPVVILSARRVK